MTRAPVTRSSSVQQQPRPALCLPRAAGDLHHPHWALGLAHRKSLDGETAQRRAPRPRQGHGPPGVWASGQRGWVWR